MTNRGENIYKRKDGRYEARYPKERDEFDRIIKYGFVYGKTYSEAKLKREVALKNIDKELKKTKLLKSFFNSEILSWLNYKEAFLKKSTYYNYYNTIYAKIIPFFNLKKLKDINKDLMFEYIQYLKNQNLSNKRIKDICLIIKQFLKYKGIHLSFDTPKNKKNNLETISKKEVSVLINSFCDSEEVKEFAIILVLFTGLRIGELCALKWENIDLENKLIYIDTTVSRIKKESSMNTTEVIIETPKTDNSIRKIPIHNELIKYLNKFKTNTDYYFLTNSSMFLPTNQYYYFYKKTLKSIGIKNYNFHILRHTFATNALTNGMDIKSLSEILGHSSVKITLDRYVHIRFEEKVKQINKLPFNIESTIISK